LLSHLKIAFEKLTKDIDDFDNNNNNCYKKSKTATAASSAPALF